jgi:hypothetical protein
MPNPAAQTVARPLPEAGSHPCPVVYVTIGRNIGLEPMSTEKWRAFRAATRAVLAASVGLPAFELSGPGGQWEGAAEEAAVFVVLQPEPCLAELRQDLLHLATDYGQEAIALAWGTSELIGT